jgi:hypothetical protein
MGDGGQTATCLPDFSSGGIRNKTYFMLLTKVEMS